MLPRIMLSNILGTSLWKVWLLPMNRTWVSYWGGSTPTFEQAARNSGSINARIVLDIVFITSLDYWLFLKSPTIAALYHNDHFAD